MFVVPANSPLKTMADMLAMARAKPGSVTVASAGTGNPTHIGFEVLKRATGLDMTYVPFAGAAPAVNALLGGHITSVYSDYTTVSAQLKAGTLRALAIGSRKRFAGLPDVPTLPELGLTDYEAESWNGVLAPAKTPKDTLAQLRLVRRGGPVARAERETRRARDLPEHRVRQGVRRQLGPAIRAVRHQHPRLEHQGGVRRYPITGSNRHDACAAS